VGDAEGGGFAVECVAANAQTVGADWQGEIAKGGKEAYVLQEEPDENTVKIRLTVIVIDISLLQPLK